MSRSSAIFTFVPAALFLTAFAGCSALPNSFPSGASVLVRLAALDVANVHLPAVMVSPSVSDSREGRPLGAFSGSANRYRNNGKERDDETILYYYGARYYAAWLGRWTSRDPNGALDGPSLYRHVAGNPVTSADQTRPQVDYSRLANPDGTFVDQSQAAAEAFLNSPNRIEQVFQDSLSGNERARALWNRLTNDFQQIGSSLAGKAAIQDILGQSPNWAWLNRMGEGPGASSLKSSLYSGFRARAQQLGLAAEVLGRFAMLVGAVTVARSALVKGAIPSVSTGANTSQELRAALETAGARTATAADLQVNAAASNRVFLGHYGDKGMLVGGLEVPIPSAGKQYLESLAAQYGGRTLGGLSGDIQVLAPHIRAADEIIFNIGRGGVGAHTPLTQQELLLIIHDPNLLPKTTFIFGATY